MNNLREFIENAAGSIKNKTFGALTSRLFLKNLQDICDEDYHQLMNDLDDKLASEEVAEIYVKGGGGTCDLDAAFDYCINDIAKEYIDGKMDDFKDEDEAETIDYAEENPKTLDEAGL